MVRLQIINYLLFISKLNFPGQIKFANPQVFEDNGIIKIM